ncbi:MAG: hypothetical protein J3Q66DRAFT_362864 [Benniella sp.]|nr:MAG: hypothetical protein J3Q66DRAFT_362864 [Benniella sp.]
MPKAPREHANQVGSASKRPTYQVTRSRRSAPAPAPVSGPAPSTAPGTVSGPAYSSASGSPATATGPASSTTSGLPATFSGPAPATASWHAFATAHGPPAPAAGPASMPGSSPAPVPVTATASSASASAAVPVPATASSATAAAPVPAAAPIPAHAPLPAVAPAVIASRRELAAQDDDVAHFFGAKVVKMFLGVHGFIQHPEHGAGKLTEERDSQTAGIARLSDMNRVMGCTYLYCGYSLALCDFALLHDLDGLTSVDQYVGEYMQSLDEEDVDLGPGAPDVRRVEEIIDYVFTNKKLIEEALTVPLNKRVRPNYERLEFLGDSVLDVIAATAWIDNGERLRRISKKAQDTVNNATLTAAGLAVGLEGSIRNRNRQLNKEIRKMKEHLRRQRAKCPPNKAYWTKDDKVKPLADVFEAVVGAVFLDTGMQLEDVENVFRRILWPLVERRLA